MADVIAPTIRIPGYTLKRELGRGGMARVYLAVQDSLDREVALKIMAPELSANPTFAARFLSEARTIAQLSHPNIIPIYDVGVTDDQVYYLSMQYLPGGDLKSRIGNRFSDAEVAAVMSGICQALAAAHERGFVHRDVKPANILFNANGTPVLTDFGIARALVTEARLTRTGVRMGTSSYMSPEQAVGGTLDARTDLYSAGVVLHELLTGKPVFEAETDLALAYLHVNQPVPPLPAKLRHWQKVVDRALAKDPEQRYADAQEFYVVVCEAAGIKPAEFTSVRFRAPVERERDGKSIAVLPFANLSRDQANDAFTVGIHDDLLTLISKIGTIKTISRSSVMHYADTTKTIPEIASELGVVTVLQGGIQRAGDQVRINVQLVEAATDQPLWAESYDRQLTAANVFSMQTEIATAIAEALQARLSPEKKRRLRQVPTENLEAYEAYLLGRQRMARRTTAGLAEAVECFHKAVELDPGFALAYLGLADSYLLQEDIAGLPAHASFVRAEAAIQEALRIDDRLSEAYASLGRIRTFSLDHHGAEAMFRRALHLDPNNAKAYHWFAILVALSDRLDEATPLLRRAIELDPLSAILNNNLADLLRAEGRFTEAMALYDKILHIDPSFAMAHVGMGRIYRFGFGKPGEAVAFFMQARSLDPGNPVITAELGGAYLELGDVQCAEEWVRRSMEMAPESFRANWALRELEVYRGEDDSDTDHRLRAIPASPANFDPLALLRHSDLRPGRFDEARAWYAQNHAGMIDDAKPAVDRTNYREALQLAFVLQNTGENERARLLLDCCEEFIKRIPRLGFFGYGIADAQIHALRGRREEALAGIRQAIDEGWRSHWWYFAGHDPKLDTLRRSPQFEAMMEEVAADMAEQLARLRSRNDKPVEHES